MVGSSSSCDATITRDTAEVSSMDSPVAKRGSSASRETTGGHGFGRLQIGRMPFERLMPFHRLP